VVITGYINRGGDKTAKEEVRVGLQKKILQRRLRRFEQHFELKHGLLLEEKGEREREASDTLIGWWCGGFVLQVWKEEH